MPQRSRSLPFLLASTLLLVGSTSAWLLPTRSGAESLPFARSRIGVQVQPMTPELRIHLGAPPDRGLLVTRVVDSGPAARAGLSVGDVLLEANQERLDQPFDLVRITARVPAGGDLSLRIVRKGKPRTLRLQPEGEATPWMDPEHWSELGERWGEWFEQNMRRGSQELRRRLEDLERRLEELERKLQDQENGPRKT